MNLNEEGLHDLNTAIKLNEQLNRPSIYSVNKNSDYSWQQHNRDVALYYKRAEVKKNTGDIDGAKRDLQTYCTLKYDYLDSKDPEYSKREFNRLLKQMFE